MDSKSISKLLQTGKNENIPYLKLYDFTRKLISADDLVVALERNQPESIAKAKIEEIVQIIIDVFSASGSTMYVAGATRNLDVIRNKFLRLNYDLVLQVCMSVCKNKTKVKNPCQYLMSMLYNANSSQGYIGTELTYPEIND